MPESALVCPDQNDLICEQILAMVRNWSPDDGECRPSQVCYAIAESGTVTYHDCASQLSILLDKGELKLEPQGRGLYIP